MRNGVVVHSKLSGLAVIEDVDGKVLPIAETEWRCRYRPSNPSSISIVNAETNPSVQASHSSTSPPYVPASTRAPHTEGTICRI